MSSDKWKIVVVDDEEDVRDVLVETINDSYEMQVIDEADSVESAIKAISNHEVDAVFLDIKIKGGDAFQLLRILERNHIEIPPVIINTGFSDFELAQRAHNEFGDRVLMILRKPFWRNWESIEHEIVQRIDRYFQKDKAQLVSQNRIHIKRDNISHFIKLEDLVLVETDLETKGRGKIKLLTTNNQFQIYKSLSSFADELPDQFIRTSRYSIINIQYISSLNHSDQTLDLSFNQKIKTVPLGDRYKAKVMARLG